MANDSVWEIHFLPIVLLSSSSWGCHLGSCRWTQEWSLMIVGNWCTHTTFLSLLDPLLLAQTLNRWPLLLNGLPKCLQPSLIPPILHLGFQLHLVIIMTFWYVFGMDFNFFELFELLFLTGLIMNPHVFYVHMTYVYVSFLMFYLSSHNYMAKRSHHRIMIFSTLEY